MEPVTPFDQLDWYADRVIAWAMSNGTISPLDRRNALEELLTIDEDSFESFMVPESTADPYPYLRADRVLIEHGLIRTRVAHDHEQRIRFERYPTHRGIRRLLEADHQPSLRIYS